MSQDIPGTKFCSEVNTMLDTVRECDFSIVHIHIVTLYVIAAQQFLRGYNIR